jgi:hypothetical protein
MARQGKEDPFDSCQLDTRTDEDKRKACTYAFFSPISLSIASSMSKFMIRVGISCVSVVSSFNSALQRVCACVRSSGNREHTFSISIQLMSIRFISLKLPSSTHLSTYCVQDKIVIRDRKRKRTALHRATHSIVSMLTVDHVMNHGDGRKVNKKRKKQKRKRVYKGTYGVVMQSPCPTSARGGMLRRHGPRVRAFAG